MSAILAQKLRFKFHYPLGGVALLVVLVAIIPLGFVLYSSLQLDTNRWLSLWTQRIPGLLFNTLSLATLVAISCVVIGVSCAWIVARKDFAGKKAAVWLLILPLTIPTYVFAHIYTTLWEDDGWLGSLWHGVFGNSIAIPDIYNISGATFVLALAGFSYVFLLARSALSISTQSLEEAARIQGASQFDVFWRINLPLLRPALVAALAVVVLHVLSDFGAVSMLRYQTFTLSIYLQMSGRFDYQAAAGLSLILVLLSLTFLSLERFFRKRQRYYSQRQARSQPIPKANRTETLFIWAWLGTIILFAFALPVGWMLVWSWDAVMKGLIDSTFCGYTFNSYLLAFITAFIATIFALPIAFYNHRNQGFTGQAMMQFSSVGFVLPGPVIALGIITFMLAQLPLLYGGLTALVLALVIRFLPLALQSQDAAMQQLTPSIEQAGRMLGAGPLENFWRVILPTIKSGMVSAWVLVFIDTLKELPATLIMRPVGFDTLPVRIWIEASEETLELAAPAAIMLVIGTLPVLWILMKGENLKN